MKSMRIALAALSFAAGCTVPSVEPAPLDVGDTAPATPGKTKKSTSSATGSGGVTPVDTTSSPTAVDDEGSSVDTTTSSSASSPSTSPATITSWTGTLASSTSVRFGGDGACEYDVVLTNIAVTLQLDAQGRAKTSKVTATMNETTPQCQFAPMGTLPLEYDYTAPAGGAGAAAAPTGLAIAPIADPDNRPQGTLSLTGTTTSASTIHTTLVFHRTDTSEAKLNWTVSVELDLTKS